MENNANPMWEPSEKLICNSNLMKFSDFLFENHGLTFKDYHDLYDWSVNKTELFWRYLWEYADFNFSGKIEKVLEYPGADNEMGPGVKWFTGIRLNFAENLLKYRDDRIAIKEFSEKGAGKNISYKELYDEVSRIRQGLIQLGVEKGDRVAAFVSNISEAVIGMLATTSIGAIWSSSSPDFGFQGVLDRFRQIEPKVLLAVDGYRYNGKNFSSLETIEKLSEKLTKTETFVIIPKIGEDLSTLDEHKQIISWHDLKNHKPNEIDFERLPFGHPVYIMYSSGTTGKPKCIVHGAGGTLLQHFKELRLHTNLKRDDNIFYFTTCGWMMWNWLVSSLNIGATALLYDGSPVYPKVDSLWKAVEDFGINIFGTSPKYLTMCEKAGLKPGEKYNLDSLKTILSTGAPLTKSNFEYVYSKVKQDIQLSSISGGTDIISCFMLGNPTLPVYQEELQCRGLGMKVESWDDDGNPHIGRKGELVCAEVFPSMPVFFWNDPDNELYKKAYFNHFPGVWRHGDYISVTERGGVVVYGRSDATLNPGGVRIGTAEIYRIVEANDKIMDSIIVSKNISGDSVIVLFVVMKDDLQLDDDFIDSMKNQIKENLTPRHVPKYIKQIKEVPVTLNGKKVEIAVTKILNGESVTNRDALANPESLEQFKNVKF